MAREFAVAFYHSGAWKRAREAYMKKVVDSPWGKVPPYVCERCFAQGETTAATVVHHVRHITPENINDPYVTLDERNFQRLCVDCHAAVHSGCERPRVAFDEMGNVVRWA